MKRQHIVRLCRAGVFAALYVALTYVTASVAISEIQFRPSEALTMLPLVFPEAVPALFIGCLIANWLAGGAILDIILGSLVTLAAAALTLLVGKRSGISNCRCSWEVCSRSCSTPFFCPGYGGSHTDSRNTYICST